jgi:methylthioribose-1-phosphate isomerase
MYKLIHHHGIPLHVVSPYTTIDPFCPNGDAIKVEERSPEEVRGVSGSFGTVRWSPKEAPVYNPAFDVTPAELVKNYILDSGNYFSETIPLTGNR